MLDLVNFFHSKSFITHIIWEIQNALKANINYKCSWKPWLEMTPLALQALQWFAVHFQGRAFKWFGSLYVHPTSERAHALHRRNYETRTLLLIKNVQNTKIFPGQTSLSPLRTPILAQCPRSSTDSKYVCSLNGSCMFSQTNRTLKYGSFSLICG